MLRKLLSLAFLIAAVSPSVVSAQDDWGLTPEEQEVWDFQFTCFELFNKSTGPADASAAKAREYKECFHDDYSGWWLADPFPLGVTEDMIYEWMRSSRKAAVWTARPLKILLNSSKDMAVTHWVAGTMRELGGTYLWHRCTSVLAKENVGGRWSYIADSCGRVVIERGGGWGEPGGGRGEPGGGRGEFNRNE